MPTKRYRIYIDESGDHTFHELEAPDKCYLGLTGIVIEAEYCPAVSYADVGSRCAQDVR